MEKEYKMEQREVSNYTLDYSSLRIENEEDEASTESTYISILSVFREIFSLSDFSFLNKKHGV